MLAAATADGIKQTHLEVWVAFLELGAQPSVHSRQGILRLQAQQHTQMQMQAQHTRSRLTRSFQSLSGPALRMRA